MEILLYGFFACVWFVVMYIAFKIGGKPFSFDQFIASAFLAIFWPVSILCASVMILVMAVAFIAEVIAKKF